MFAGLSNWYPSMWNTNNPPPSESMIRNGTTSSAAPPKESGGAEGGMTQGSGRMSPNGLSDEETNPGTQQQGGALESVVEEQDPAKMSSDIRRDLNTSPQQGGTAVDGAQSPAATSPNDHHDEEPDYTSRKGNADVDEARVETQGSAKTSPISPPEGVIGHTSSQDLTPILGNEKSGSQSSELANPSPGSIPGAPKGERGQPEESMSSVANNGNGRGLDVGENSKGSVPLPDDSAHDDAKSATENYEDARTHAEDANHIPESERSAATGSGGNGAAFQEPTSSSPGSSSSEPPYGLSDNMSNGSSSLQIAQREESTQDRINNHNILSPMTENLHAQPLVENQNSQRNQTAAAESGESGTRTSSTPLVTDELPEDCENLSIPDMNVVIFGETGVGKSSVINLIAGEKRANTSNSALGCTFQHTRHEITLDQLTCALWDTTGLDEGSEGTVPAEVAEKNLKVLIEELAQTKGIHLVVYCIRATRLTKALKRNYDLFYVTVCRKKVPVALVVTGLEHQEGGMGTWWDENEKSLRRAGMRFNAHACVTTLDAQEDETVQQRRSESQSQLRELLLNYSKLPPWKVQRSLLTWILLTLRGALNRPTGGSANMKILRRVTICDMASDHQIPVQVSPGINVPCQKYGGRIGEKQYDFVRVDKNALETVSQPEEGAGVLVFYTSGPVEAEMSQADITSLKTFYENAGGNTCPVIVVLRDCDDEKTVAKIRDDVASRYSDIRAEFTSLPGAGGRPDKLNDMIEGLCLENSVALPEPKASKLLGIPTTTFVNAKKVLQKRLTPGTRAADGKPAKTVKTTEKVK